MIWFNHSEQKPFSLPRREILARFSNGHHSVYYSTEYPQHITHWAEIEEPEDSGPVSPPTKSDPPPPDPFEQGMADHKAGRVVDMETALNPPPPDPFEEAWNEHCGRYQGPTPYATFKDGWNAAIKFAAAKL